MKNAKTNIILTARRTLDSAYISHNALIRCMKSAASQLELTGGETLLDVGCGTRPYEQIFCSRGVANYVGMEVSDSGHPPELKTHDIIYDGVNFPFSEKEFDIVLCTQVLEHVADPSIILQESWRVLKPGGYLILTAPFCWGEHEIPQDYWRFSSYGLKLLLTQTGFEVFSCARSTGTLETIAQLTASFLSIHLAAKLPKFFRAIAFSAIFVFQLLAILIQKIMPPGDLYLDTVIVARRKEWPC